MSLTQNTQCFFRTLVELCDLLSIEFLKKTDLSVIEVKKLPIFLKDRPKYTLNTFHCKDQQRDQNWPRYCCATVEKRHFSKTLRYRF